MNEKNPFSVNVLDIKIVIASGLCLLTAKWIPEFQIMTACIAILLCVQDNVKISGKAGFTRLIVTALGGSVGVLVILGDNYFKSQLLFYTLIIAGLFITLWCCKAVGIPAFNSRIGGATFILVVFSRTGSERIYYAFFRLLSTLYGVIAVIIVSLFFVFIEKLKRKQ
jgi:uncharacterized membrane protein YgaE (UPF0421/DUF939 family)